MNFIWYLLQCIVEGFSYAFGHGNDSTKGLIAIAIDAVILTLIFLSVIIIRKNKKDKTWVFTFGLLLTPGFIVVFCILSIIIELIVTT